MVADYNKLLVLTSFTRDETRLSVAMTVNSVLKKCFISKPNKYL